MTNPFSLEGKTILITGAASGIGKATARLCAESGAHLVLLDLNADGLKTTVDEIGQDVAEGYALNLCDYEQLCERYPNCRNLMV